MEDPGDPASERGEHSRGGHSRTEGGGTGEGSWPGWGQAGLRIKRVASQPRAVRYEEGLKLLPTSC